MLCVFQIHVIEQMLFNKVSYLNFLFHYIFQLLLFTKKVIYLILTIQFYLSYVSKGYHMISKGNLH